MFREFGDKVIAALMLTTTIAGVCAGEALTIRTDVPSTAPRVHVPLQVTVVNENQVHPASRELESIPIGAREDKVLGLKGFSSKFLIGCSGKERYVLYVRPETKLPWLGTQERRTYSVQGWRISQNLSESEKLFDGLVMADLETRIFVPRSPSKGTNIPPYRLAFSLHLSRTGGERDQIRAMGSLASTLRVNGSTSVGESNISVNIHLTSENVLPQEAKWSAFVSRPHVEQEPSPVVPLNTNVESGGMLLAMEALAADLSGTTIAVLRSTKVEPPPEIKELPDFARVDLLRRATITRDKLLSAAQESAGIVFVVAQSIGIQLPPGYLASGSLAMDEQAVVDRLCEGQKQPPLVCFVTTKVSAATLFVKYVDKTPSFYLLCDPSDASAVSVSTAGEHYYTTYPSCSPAGGCLSRKLGVTGNDVAVLAFDREGKLVLKRTARQGTLPDVLYEARQALTK